MIPLVHVNEVNSWRMSRYKLTVTTPEKQKAIMLACNLEVDITPFLQGQLPAATYLGSPAPGFQDFCR